MLVGRYAMFDELAAGGMATVHLGRLLGPAGLGRPVAIKRLHVHFLKDEEFVTMFMDEARIVARIRHPNVVPMLEVVQTEQGLFLVMEYIHGESLAKIVRTLRKSGEPIAPRIVASVMSGVLLGLHAAHDTTGPDGALLGVVHRDVSPQNIIVGAEGTAHVLDFGIAKAAGRAQVTREGQVKGKLAYMAPEQIRGQADRRSDVFAAAVVLWEMLAGRRMHEGFREVDILSRVIGGTFPQLREMVPDVDPELDRIVSRGLAIDPEQRYSTAREFAIELERAVGLASPREVGEWVHRVAKDVLESRAALVRQTELAASSIVQGDDFAPAALSSGTLPRGAETLPSVRSALPSGASLVNEIGRTGPRPTAPQQGGSLFWPFVVVSFLLALAGITLGTYALVHRASAPRSAGDPSSAPAE
jgi:serine/threonine-protein kinase